MSTKNKKKTKPKQNNVLSKEDLRIFAEAEQIIKNNEKKANLSTTTIFILSAILICIVLFCSIFALSNIGNKKILKNISIMGVDVSKLTIEQANEKLNNELGERATTEILLNHNDEEYILPPQSIEVSFDFENAVNEAYSIGRDGNFIQNNFSILGQMLKRKNISVKLSYNEDTLQGIIMQLNEQFKDGIKEFSYDIEETNLVIIAGKNGVKVNEDAFKEKLAEKLLTESEYNSDKIEIPVEQGECKKIDIEQIHNEIYKEAVDATYTVNPYNITASQTGLDFNISIDEAKAIIGEEKETYTIPLKILYPSITTDAIGAEAFPDKLATYTSSYATSNANRSNNVALAASKINGTVLMPGETFSYNGTVGKRTIQAGFKEAGAYFNGQVVSEVGGGICQVSSTLYNSVLRANLEIVDRTNHMFPVGYVPIGTDATVSWGAPDFQFKNNRDYAIRIVATTRNKQVTVQIFGLRQEDDYDVEIQSYTTGTVPFKTTYTTDASLGKGNTRVIQAGSNGSTSVTYKILKKDGQLIIEADLDTDFEFANKHHFTVIKEKIYKTNKHVFLVKSEES